jgi:Fic family protein
MKPPYEITYTILKLVGTISQKIGEVNAGYLNKQSPQLRKQNKIKTIHSSLQIEGNTLSEEQISAIIENKKVIGPASDILEVQNAIKVYDSLVQFQATKEKSFLKAHQILMRGLLEKPGSYRTKSVGIVQGTKVAHVAPSASILRGSMKNLFSYLKDENELNLIKSCVFHYEIEFIHPFLDGNGRMGRLWQTVILMQEYPVFEFLPFETLISKTQKEYYQALAISDKQGKSTVFIEYMLNVIDQSLEQLLNYIQRTLTERDRIEYFIAFGAKNFTRKDYMRVFKDISSATASRDLKKALELKLLKRTGSHNTTKYSPL